MSSGRLRRRLFARSMIAADSDAGVVNAVVRRHGRSHCGARTRDALVSARWPRIARVSGQEISATLLRADLGPIAPSRLGLCRRGRPDVPRVNGRPCRALSVVSLDDGRDLRRIERVDLRRGERVGLSAGQPEDVGGRETGDALTLMASNWPWYKAAKSLDCKAAISRWSRPPIAPSSATSPGWCSASPPPPSSGPPHPWRSSRPPGQSRAPQCRPSTGSPPAPSSAPQPAPSSRRRSGRSKAPPLARSSALQPVRSEHRDIGCGQARRPRRGQERDILRAQRQGLAGARDRNVGCREHRRLRSRQGRNLGRSPELRPGRSRASQSAPSSTPQSRRRSAPPLVPSRGRMSAVVKAAA